MDLSCLLLLTMRSDYGTHFLNYSEDEEEQSLKLAL